jgi:streptogramin lyase
MNTERGVARLLASASIIATLMAGCDSDTEKSALSTAADAEIFVPTLEEYPVPAGSRPHDVAPGADEVVWLHGSEASGARSLGSHDGSNEAHRARGRRRATRGDCRSR